MTIVSSLISDKFLMNQPGRRRLEVQIGKRTNIEHLIGRLSIVKKIPNLNINLTLDCMENIYDDRIELERKFITVSDVRYLFFYQFALPIFFSLVDSSKTYLY